VSVNRIARRPKETTPSCMGSKLLQSGDGMLSLNARLETGGLMASEITGL
jgi:hypothetical protein